MLNLFHYTSAIHQKKGNRRENTNCKCKWNSKVFFFFFFTQLLNGADDNWRNNTFFHTFSWFLVSSLEYINNNYNIRVSLKLQSFQMLSTFSVEKLWNVPSKENTHHKKLKNWTKIPSYSLAKPKEWKQDSN